jgi:GNAT superfamily N-acetyltransferase
MTKDEALAFDLALEVLEICAVRQEHQWHGLQKLSMAKAAIKQARSAPVQEPVAWRVRFRYGTDGMDKRIGDWRLHGYSPTPEKDKEIEPLYTTLPAQRQWVGLTDEEIEECVKYCRSADGLARAIEAKLKEKNT